MSAMPDLQPDSVSCLDLLEACHGVVDRALDAVAHLDGQDFDLGTTLGRTERLARRVEALRVRLIAAAHARSVAGREADASTTAWVARTTMTDRRRASLDAALAASLGNPRAQTELAVAQEAAGPHPSPTSQALDNGLISADHARVILGALADCPEWLETSCRETFERRLIHLAGQIAPGPLRRTAREILKDLAPPQVGDALDSHESQILQHQEERAHDAARFWLRDNGDGTTTGQFTVPTLAGDILRKVIDAMTAPRRRSGSTERAGDAWRADQLDWQHRRGLAFTELLAHLPTDHLHERTAATVVVTTRLADLRTDLQRSGNLDTGRQLSAGEVRRAACTAGIVPAVLGTESVPVDLGRQTRCFTSTQRAALATIHTECAAQGCDRPFAWTEIHHQRAWSGGGTTDLANAIPLCGTHHRLLHQDHPHTIRRSGPQSAAVVTFHPRR